MGNLCQAFQETEWGANYTKNCELQINNNVSLGGLSSGVKGGPRASIKDLASYTDANLVRAINIRVIAAQKNLDEPDMLEGERLKRWAKNEECHQRSSEHAADGAMEENNKTIASAATGSFFN